MRRAGLLLAVAAVAVAAMAATAVGGPASITGSIVLKHSEVRAGGAVRAEVVFRNHTSKPIVLMHGCKINGLYAVGLRGLNGAGAFLLAGCSPEQALIAKPGITRYGFKFAATYDSCSQSAKDEGLKGSKYWSPLCLRKPAGPGGVMPPLPSGKYTAVFFPEDKWHGPPVKSAALFVIGKK